jgi:tRNA(Ile)-lysidine synthase
MIKQAKKFIKNYQLITYGDRILVGVSGGPDSIALLYLLNSLKKELGLTLYIGHLDHMLRKASAKDAVFVRKIAEKLKIPITVKAVDIKAKHKKGSLEESARTIRLEFLANLAKKISADKIALGHNLDDQAETVLMRILRGTGLYGLGGILPRREINGTCFIRPLLETRRKDIQAYLLSRKISPRLDSSNLEEKYLRNKIRHKLIPFLEKYFNRKIKISLARLAQSASFDYNYLEEIAKRSLKSAKNELTFKMLHSAHPALRRLIIRQKIAGIQQSMRRITYQHMLEIEDLLLNRPSGSLVNLPKGIRVKKSKNSLRFYR